MRTAESELLRKENNKRQIHTARYIPTDLKITGS